jgi:hypothetical protein
MGDVDLEGRITEDLKWDLETKECHWLCYVAVDPSWD